MSNINLSWMKNLDGEKKLLQYTIPGTHDCATQYVDHSMLCKCQDKNISEQLNLGVRALDIRVRPIKDKLILVHSSAKAYIGKSKSDGVMYLDYLLNQCYEFLKNNPSETIIFQFKNDSDDKYDIDAFHNLYYTYIKGNEDKWFLENRMPTLNECRGKLVLLRRCLLDESNTDFIGNSGLDLSRWHDQDTAVPYARMLHVFSEDQTVFEIHDRYKYQREERWKYCIEPFFKDIKGFDGKYILCYLSTAGGIKGPKYNAKYINEKFMSFDLNKDKYYGLMYFDFIDDKIANKVIDLNF